MEILIVDDHPVFRAGLRQILLDYSQDLVISEAGSGVEALEYLNAQPPDAVVLDVSLPDLNGIEVLRQIRRDHPSLPVLLLTMHSEEQYEKSACKAGATGFLSKAGEPERVAEAILWVARQSFGRKNATHHASGSGGGPKEGRSQQDQVESSHKLH